MLCKNSQRTYSCFIEFFILVWSLKKTCKTSISVKFFIWIIRYETYFLFTNILHSWSCNVNWYSGIYKILVQLLFFKRHIYFFFGNVLSESMSQNAQNLKSRIVLLLMNSFWLQCVGICIWYSRKKAKKICCFKWKKTCAIKI